MLQPPAPAALIDDAPGLLAARLALDADKGGLILLDSEERAAALAPLLRAFAPDACVVHYPANDALRGAGGAASAANIGARISALRQLATRGDRHAFLIAGPEATLERLLPPSAYAPAPPRIAPGDPIDRDAFTAFAEGLGYLADDRVDEAGEFVVRGSVIDLFPVDRTEAVRIAIEDDRVAAIQSYDPLSQRTSEPLNAVDIGHAVEPQGQRDATLADHVGGGVYRAERFDAIRRRMAAMPGAHAARIVDEAAWRNAIDARAAVQIDAPVDAPPRFAEQKNPRRAFQRFAKLARADAALVLVGCARDLRFLLPRIEKALGQECAQIDALADAAGRVGDILALEAPLERGFVLGGIVAVAAADLLGGRALRASGVGSAANLFALGQIEIGDVVIHESFGLGRVQGLETLPDGSEAVCLVHARDGRRLVPLAELDRVWRYGADAAGVTLDGLDGKSWAAKRAAVHAAIDETAEAMVALADERLARSVDPIEPEPSAYERFVAGFPFNETPDQARAIAAVRDDLASGKPMDRIVIGDVGFGKTEIALRAAALAALAGRQVVLAAPTTVLVRQHLELFRRRFAGTDIVVAGLSRLDDAATQKATRAGLQDGSIRIVIGTSAVAAKAVRYADLALVIIDEEQRFGARDKARLKALGAGHSLLLSATPIPRSLQSALVGLQQMSVIATPPARRQPVRTLIGEAEDPLIQSALLREAARGGQSFLVVPRIEDLAPLQTLLARIVPQLGVQVVHGKLPVGEIDEAMVAFAAGDGDILLSTNIIEAGLDIPRANTMIVHRADRFGLAQLHQLRGRVGRGNRRGQFLLTTEPGTAIAAATAERLRTLQTYEDLGAGFAISARDLDLRGAGDLLGEDQAGHVKLIGVDLYRHLLTHALRAVRGEPAPRPLPEINLGGGLCLPADWIPEAAIRLRLYVRLSRTETIADLDAIEAELEDRFGTIPAPACDLLAMLRVRVIARAAGIARIDAGPGGIALTPADDSADLGSTELTRKGDRWVWKGDLPDAAERIGKMRELVEACSEA